MKRCSKCGFERHDEEFSRQAASVDGLQVWCKECFLRLPVAPLRPLSAPIYEKLCPQCGEVKHSLDFSMLRADPSYGLQSWCKLCMAFYKKSRRQKKSVSQIVFERHQREQIKQDKYEALKKNLPPLS